MDGLERKIKAEKNSLDTLTPNVELWMEISKEIPQSKQAVQKSLWVRYRKVAYLVAASLIGILVIPTIVVANQKPDDYVALAETYNQDFPEIKTYFLQKYQEQYTAIEQAGIDTQPLMESIQQLEADYNLLKEELDQTTDQNRAFLVEQMIQNMNSRVELLSLFYQKHKNVVQ